MADAHRRICRSEEVAEGKARKFRFSQDGIPREGFALRIGGKLYAYENVCRHLPVPLDYGDGVFLDSSQTHVVCQTHGALYEPETGQCVRGPCAGANLKALQLIEVNGEVRLVTGDAVS